MAARTLAFTLGALFTHELITLPDPLYLGLAPLLLPVAWRGGRCAVGAAFLLGIVWTALHGQMALDRRLPAHAQGADVVIDGRVIAVTQASERRVRFSLRPEHITAVPLSAGRLGNWSWHSCQISVSWYRPGAESRPRAGERWRMALRLRQPRGLRNVSGFDSEHRALRDRRCATAYVRNGNVPMRLAGSHWSLNRLREHIASRLNAQLRDSPVTGVIIALAVGIREHISVSQRWVLQLTGTAHLMAISGLHIGLVAALGMVLGGTLARAAPRLLLIVPASCWGAALALVLAMGYAALAGFSVPTQRALLMLGVFLTATVLSRRIARHHGLAMALLVVLLIDPLAAYDAGTWLSFVAVAGLMWAVGPQPATGSASGSPRELLGESRRESSRGGAPVVPSSNDWLRQIVLRMRLAVRVQFAATVVVLPLALACFGFQSWLSPLANLLAIPITGLLVVPLTLSAVLLEPIVPAVAEQLVRLAATLMQGVFVVLDWLAAIDLVFMPANAPSIGALLAALIGVAVLLSPMALRVRLIGLFWLAPLVVPPSSAPPPSGLDLHVLDVGQGLAVLLRTHSHALLFDAGPAWSNGNDAGASVVVPKLRSLGIARLERVLISHRHLDHAGGLTGVLRSTPNAQILGDHGFRHLRSQPCAAGQRWRWDGYDFAILHPANDSKNGHGRWRKSQLGNDSSCVLRVSGPGGSVLLPADIEAPAEAALVRAAGTALASDIMLVPHHGSKTSSTLAFLQVARPRLAINSSGHRNRFSLPAAPVTERYRDLEIPFVDTACVGAIDLALRASQAPRLRYWAQSHRRFWHSRDSGGHCRR